MYYVLGEIYSRVVIFAVRDAFAKFAKIKPPRIFQLVQYHALEIRSRNSLYVILSHPFLELPGGKVPSTDNDILNDFLDYG